MKTKNKKILPLWEHLLEVFHQYVYHFHQYSKMVLFILLLFGIETSRAQGAKEVNTQAQVDFKPLKSGNPIPDEIWETTLVMHDLKGGSKTIPFKDLKGKVILFDFWATTCPSCIEGFPKMEELQKKYGNDLAIILVNSKRNKDTPKRLKAVFDNYKRTYNYEMSLPSLLDDTVFTSLFPHYSIPTYAWVDREGKLVIVDKGNDNLEKRVKSLIAGEQVDVLEMGLMINADRTYNPPLVDTVGMLSTSIFTKPVPNFFATQKNVYYTNGHTHFQLGNHSLFSILLYAFGKELAGFHLYEYVFDPQLRQGNHFQMCQALNDTYWYEMYRADSIGREKVRELVRSDVMRFFQLEVVRETVLREVYELEILPEFSKLESKGGMPFVVNELSSDEMQLNNAQVFQFLNLLYPYLDRPVLFNKENRTKFNLLLPKGFINLSLPDKLSFLASKGLHLKPVKKVIEYPYFNKTN